MTKHIVIDIETLPCEDADKIAYLLSTVKADSRLKDPEKIAADTESKTLEAVCKTGLDGSFGRVLCATVADADSDMIFTVSHQEADEKHVLTGILDAIDAIVRLSGYTPLRPVIIGHNVAWDLRFIAQRCVVNGIPFNKKYIPFDAKPWEQVDTMLMWAGATGKIALDRLCVALGVDSPKSEMDGSMIAEYYKQGRLAEILQYNKADVMATKACYLKMRAAGMTN